MTYRLPKMISGNFRQGALYPPCLPAGYTLVSGSSSRRMDYLPRIVTVTHETNPQYYHIHTPDGALDMTFIGGDLLPAGDGYVWLTTPRDNKPLMRVPCQYVSKSSPEETAARLLADARAFRTERAP